MKCIENSLSKYTVADAPQLHLVDAAACRRGCCEGDLPGHALLQERSCAGPRRALRVGRALRWPTVVRESRLGIDLLHGAFALERQLRSAAQSAVDTLTNELNGHILE